MDGSANDLRDDGREAIQSCVSVGFVPFRIRREGKTLIPEVLPLGTYSWTVNSCRNKRFKASEQEEGASMPLLFYDVTSLYCKEPIHVFNYVMPHANLTCFSPLASLIPQYNTLVSLRELSLHAIAWNSKPSIVLEEQEKLLLNGVADSGACITMQSNPLTQARSPPPFFLGADP